MCEYIRMEPRHGKFLKKFRLPENANSEDICACYEDGVPTITVQKEPFLEPKKVFTVTVQNKPHPDSKKQLMFRVQIGLWKPTPGNITRPGGPREQGLILSFDSCPWRSFCKEHVYPSAIHINMSLIWYSTSSYVYTYIVPSWVLVMFCLWHDMSHWTCLICVTA